MKALALKFAVTIVLLASFCIPSGAQPQPKHHLQFQTMPTQWYEGLPLGNGWLGVLLWQKNERIRMSLDRVDLWDDRPMPEIDKLRFDWVKEQVLKNQYDTVQTLGDEPYEKYAAPTKIPGAALEFDCRAFGPVKSARLDIGQALATVEFSNGVRLNSYVHANEQIGFFGFENLKDPSFIPELLIPNYNTGASGKTGNSVEGQSLERLGYAKGKLDKSSNSIRYHQPTWNGHYYEVLVQWQQIGDNLIGQWTISVDQVAKMARLSKQAAEPTRWPSHLAWWKKYWSKSSVHLPDTLLEKQYYLEMYKFGCVARSNTPPISLQAIWTADNGNLPPWKGDYHHDLNTQLSYWPGYTGNHLDLTASYTNWLWKTRAENKRWTKAYFGTDGLNVPGVNTISGKPMGGWIQYSMSPTTSAWVAQHFYWQWKYSMDSEFLKQKARPYLLDVAHHLDQITHTENGQRKLSLSSSPEVFDNSIKAWFLDFSNHDLALVKNALAMTKQVLKPSEAEYWNKIQADLPAFAQAPTGLSVAPGFSFEHSHRHHAHLMSIYPLKVLNDTRETDRTLMNSSLDQLEKVGTREWCGYSFAWAACLQAQAKRADQALEMLQIFARNFCSTNSFHVNGDQKGGQYSNFTYHPFTLEGNFAFAQGVHELLLQSHDGMVEVFPALPSTWRDVSFNNLRAEGAFLISAEMKHGVVKKVEVVTKKRGTIYLRLPEGRWTIPDGWIIPYGNDPNEFRIELSRNEKFELINLNLSDYELRKKWYN
jgi:alpha-L-fucosidase 2